MKYYAFISYRRKDEKWAIWLQRKLERYRLPSVLCRERNIPRRLKPVCRDKTDLSVGVLIPCLREKITESRFLIVICSIEATKSDYINQEVSFFASVHGKDKICPLVVDGIPYSTDGRECYPDALRSLFPDGCEQILGANVSESGQGCRFIKRQRAFIMILSRILGVSFDALWKRHKRYLIKKIIVNIVMFSLLLSLPVIVWSRTKAFNMQLDLIEANDAGPGLSGPKGIVTLYFGTDSLQRSFASFDDSIQFSNLPGNLKRKAADVSVRVFGYSNVDTTLTISERVTFYVRREPSCFGHIEGMVRNEKDQLLSGATVRIGEVVTQTDSDGYFVMDIPISKQSASYHATVEYMGRKTIVDCIYPMQGNPLIVNTIYFE